MDVIQFQEKLRNICELGKQNGNMLTHEQIREHFASTDLETSQMLKVLQYLKLQGIMIEGDTAITEAICPDTLAPAACMRITFVGSSSMAIF